MFGELIGLWLADLWMRAGRPATAHYVELGPGRGTLAADALRAMRSAGLQPPANLVENSPTLSEAQAVQVPAARWHRSEEHTSELQSQMRLSYAVFCLTKKSKRTDKHKPALPS